MEWWKKWRAQVARKKREKWELENLSPEQRNKHFGKSKEDVQKDTIESVVSELKRLQGRIETFENTTSKRDGWKVIQNKDGKTKWYKQDAVKYVSEIYTSGPENTFYFDVIIEGVKLTFSADTENDAKRSKLELLDIDRIEEYDQETQEEMFPKSDEDKA